MAKRTPPICIISPSRRLAAAAQKVVDDLGENIEIHVATLETARNRALELIQTGTEVIISRGGLKASLDDIPDKTVVGIRMSLSDYVRILEKARHVDGPVAFFEYYDVPENVEVICRLLNIQIRTYRFRASDDGEKCVLAALDDGAVLGIGGVLTEGPALRHGLPYVLRESSRESIVAAIDEAKKILSLQIHEREKRTELQLRLERYQAVVDFSHDAIVSIDAAGKIDVANQVAENILKKRNGDIIGQNIEKIIPGSHMPEVLKTGRQQLDRLNRIGNVMVSTNCVPIVVDSDVKGVVATFQDIRTIQTSEQNIRLSLHERGLAAKYSFRDILGSSHKITGAIQAAKSYAEHSATVLIHGETGTGKELFAQSIHNASARKDRPFVSINCATLEKNLLESELFGYTEGAFTGAVKGGKAGLFELAHGGTLFLDEIGEISVELQAKLLRVLQEKEIRRMGAGNIIPVDVRIIAATHKNLEDEVREGRFRQDVFYRLNVLDLHIPPLREREDDVLLLADAMFGKFNRRRRHAEKERFFSLVGRLKDYAWPGNIRELQNIIERISMLVDNEETHEQINGLIERLLQKKTPAKAETPVETWDQNAWEKTEIVRALRETRGRIGKAAEHLGMSRTTLWKKMKQHRIRTALH